MHLRTLFIVPALLALTASPVITGSGAQAAVLIEEDEQAVVSGTIIDIVGEELTVRAGQRNFKIDLDDVDLEVRPESVLQVGGTVAVSGEIESEANDTVFMEGRRLIMVTDTMTESDAVDILINSQHHVTYEE